LKHTGSFFRKIHVEVKHEGEQDGDAHHTTGAVISDEDIELLKVRFDESIDIYDLSPLRASKSALIDIEVDPVRYCYIIYRY